MEHKERQPIAIPASASQRKLEPLGGPFATSREFFLRGLSACYFAAFGSFLVQVRGLYGPDGLYPSSDSSMESDCIWGLCLATLGLAGCANIPVMWGMLSLYRNLIESASGPFYFFQWDSLLIEVGFLGAMLAPMLHSSLEPRPSRATIWMLRMVLFKLMLMSGVVKLTEGDDSWKELTAIWYHFASQCIPTPAAWFLHHLPMPVEKLFCAIMFAIEIPVAFLILVPVRSVQRLAACLQIALQLIIIVSGNYTFFNYLTIFLACMLLYGEDIPWFMRPSEPCSGPAAILQAWHDQVPESCISASVGTGHDTTPMVEDTEEIAQREKWRSSVSRHLHHISKDVAEHGSAEKAVWETVVGALDIRQHQKRLWMGFASLCLLVCLVWSCVFSVGLGLNGKLSLMMSNNELTAWTSRFVPLAFLLVSVVLPTVTFFDILNLMFVDGRILLDSLKTWTPSKRNFLWTVLGVIALVLLVLRAIVCMDMLIIMARPLARVAPSLRHHNTRVSVWTSDRNKVGLPFGLPSFGDNPYGLFRSMTGIGPGVSVARPEVILEVQDASGSWRELQFPYKPGDITRMPPIIAPYQPRLDWQMWFQALSSPEDWFVTLLQKIAAGSPSVLALLDTSSLPGSEITAVRALSYTYRFTNHGESGWWQREKQNIMVSPDQIDVPEPVNLVNCVAKEPWEWRPFAVSGFLFVAVILNLLPYGFRTACLWSRASVKSSDKEA